MDDPGRFGSVWSYVSPRLGEPSTPRSYDFIDERVRAICRDEPGCRYTVYDSLVKRLEEVFHLPAAVYAAEQRLSLARFSELDDQLSGDYFDLFRFHDALGNFEIAAVNLDNAIAAARRSDNFESLEYFTLVKMKDAVQYQDQDLAFAALDSFLRAAEKRGDNHLVMRTHEDMIALLIEYDRLAEAENHIAALEAYPFSDTLTKDEVNYQLNAASGRGDLADRAGKPELALLYYRKALEMSRIFPSHWFETNFLNKVARQQGILGKESEAWRLLDTAITSATTFGLIALLAEAYEISAMLAEQEEDYAKALRYQKLYQVERSRSDQRTAGFNTRNYYLRQEKEALEAARETQQAQLQLQQVYSRTLLVSVVIISTLALILILAYRNQRRRRQELAQRNVLISEQAEQLEELDQVKNTFFANVSHELRTPLTLIVGPLSTLLRDPALTDRQRKLLGLISSSGHRLETLVADLLRLSALERDQTRLDLEMTALNPFFNEPFDQFTALAGSQQLHFSSKVDIATGTSGNLDREKCRRIIFNLLSNAFKHTPAEGRIHAEVQLTDGELLLSVQDSGSGIHPDDLPHIFDRYWQSSRQEKTAGGGLGIGLSLCRKYVHLFGGEIHVESLPGKGAHFRVTFPIVTELSPAIVPSPPAPRPAAQAAFPPASRPTILVAEDNPDLGDYLRVILSDDYTIVVKEDGRAALDHLRQAPGSVDLLITDLMMPVMDGFALLAAIKADSLLEDLPVVVVTARSGEADKLRILRLGIDDYLVKPFSQSELQTRIENLLRNREVRIAQPRPVEEEVRDGRDTLWLEEFERYVRTHCGNPNLTVQQLSHQFAMSESTLLRRLKSLIGLTPQKYVQEVRLERARRRLETHDFDTLEQLAREVGYRSARNLSRSFVRRFGRTPTSYLPD